MITPEINFQYTEKIHLAFLFFFAVSILSADNSSS